MKNKLTLVFTFLIALILLISGYFYLTKNHDDDLTLYGNVDIREVRLAFQVGGQIKQLTVDEGDSVKTGQVLAVLDDKSYKAQLENATAQVATAQAQLDKVIKGPRDSDILKAKASVEAQQSALNNAEKNYERILDLYKTKTVSQATLDNATTQKNTMAANLDAAKASLLTLTEGSRPEDIAAARAQLQSALSAQQAASINLSNTSLIAPQSGVISTRAYEVGSVVAAGAPIYSLSLTKPVRIRAYVDEKNIGHIHLGQMVTIETDGNAHYTGKIGYISSTAEFTPKTVQTPGLRVDLVYRFWITVETPAANLRQGMPVTIHVLKDQTSAEK